MENIEQRLKEATDVCLKTYEEWNKNKKDNAVRESLMEAVHELRKVAARLEIEMAISERNEVAAKPIPIPSHRAKKKKDDSHGGNKGGNPQGGDQKKPPRKKTGTDKDSE